MLKRTRGSRPIFRLSQKHSRHLGRTIPPVSAEELLAAQSVRAAISAAALATIGFNILWAYLASASGSFFPWVAVVQGAVIGIAVQRSGHGLDWRFPLIAGVAAWIASFSGNLFIAIMFTAANTGVIANGWWAILQGFFANTVSPIDVIYALCAVAVATFYSKKRLNRHEVLALRTYGETRT